MNVRQLQVVDRWLGIPLCFALTLVHWATRRSRRPVSAPLRSVLFVKLAEQGSTVLAYPALRRATELVGRENVYFISFEDNRFILDLLGVIPEANVITIKFRGLPSLLRSAVAALIRMRRLKLGAAIDMEFFARGSAALAYLSGAERRAGFHAFFGGGPYRGNLMTHRVLYNRLFITARQFKQSSRPCAPTPRGFPPTALRPRLPTVRPPPSRP